MQLPKSFSSYFSKKGKEITYLSLYLDIHTVAASFWQMREKGIVRTIASAHLPVKNDSWEARIDAVDHLLGALEEKTNTSEVTTTILGLPPSYLTPIGEIKKEIRAQVKLLSEELELTLAGFVPLHQAIIFKMKMDEGVPPSVIVLGINGQTISISLYKIGSLIDVREVEKHDDIALDIEHGLKSFNEVEVLPARILLHGGDDHVLSNIKVKLMRHSWTTKANFLHFPKIEVVAFDYIVDAVSLAGASEMKNEMGEDEGTETITVPEQVNDQADDVIEKEVKEAQKEIDEEYNVVSRSEDDNVEMVDAETLGFARNEDILEEPKPPTQRIVQEKISSIVSVVAGFFQRLRLHGLKKKATAFIVVGVAAVALLTWLFFFMVPKAVITVFETPKIIEKEQSITIDPSATLVDTAEQIIPGHQREQEASGEKTVPVTGKKNIGDPAVGTVTIYNKSLNSQTFKKGTVISTGSLKFTLDADVQVASASESIGSITFGKADVSTTAVSIGAQSNITSGSEFTLANTSSSIAIARNDAAFTGGTSREVVVVTRADQDAFVKLMSEELTTQAKTDLNSAVTGAEGLIDATIKTTVKEKVFQQELDQESTSLSGKVTVSVTGIAYSQEDISTLFLSSIQSELPEGYTVENGNMNVTVSGVKVAKDGKISATIRVHATALPVIDMAALPAKLAGKNITTASDYLKTIPGIAGVEVDFQLSLTKRWLPINKKHISVSVAVAQ